MLRCVFFSEKKKIRIFVDDNRPFKQPHRHNSVKTHSITLNV